jgi:cytochrome c553
MPGLDPGIHQESPSMAMDCRVKPGNDEGACVDPRGECSSPHVANLIVALLLAGLSALSLSAQPLAERRPACLACHGENGQSETPETPSLGGQPEFYVTVQLLMFRERMRVVALMNDTTRGLTDDDLKALAAFISKLPPPQPAAGLSDPVRMARARDLVQEHKCNVCHRPDFSGQENVPRIAAQREDYLVKSLRDYKSNVRRGYDAAMADVMHPITDADILDLAYFLARVR